MLDLRSRVGEIDSFVAESLGLPLGELYTYKEKGRFSAEQVLSIALAIDKISQGRALIVGHEMGVGKGRIVAALMWYAQRQGLSSIFVTKDPHTLYPSMLDDLEDIGAVDASGRPIINPLITDVGLATQRRNGAPVVTDNKQKSKLRIVTELGKLPSGYNAIFTSYYQLNVRDAKAAALAVAPGAIVVFDESHIGTGKDSSMGDASRQLAAASRGVMYSSATAIKRLDSVGSYFDKTSMNKAVASPEVLARLTKKFKNPFLEMLSKMLTRAGEMIRYQRGLTHEGKPVEFRSRALKTGPKVVAANNSINEILGEMKRVERGAVMRSAGSDIASQFAQYIQKVTGQRPTGATAKPYPLAGQFHNVANLMLLASKVDEAVAVVREYVKAGQKVFISLDSTNEAAVDDILKTDPLDGYKMPVGNYADYMYRYVDKMHRITVTLEMGEGRQIKQDFFVNRVPPWMTMTDSMLRLQEQLL